jgi:hypothetical protein
MMFRSRPRTYAQGGNDMDSPIATDHNFKNRLLRDIMS